MTVASTHRATWAGAPADGWRMMKASTPMAATVSTVSRSDSPFLTDEEATAKESTSADSRLAAVSKENRVRVDSSANSVTTVRPRRAGTLGMGRRATSTKASDTRSTSSMPSAPRSAMDRRWRPSPGDAGGFSSVGVSLGAGGPVHRGTTSPRTTPSRLTSTCSSRRVGMFLPT